MVGKFQIRTDLALEARESCEAEDVKIRGVRVQEDHDEEREIFITTIMVESENGARAIGKPVGTYMTLETPHMSVPDEDYHREISEKLANCLKQMIRIDEREGHSDNQKQRKKDLKHEGDKAEAGKKTVLVVGLGNRQITPDALGPEVVDNLHITRHILKEYGRMAENMGISNAISVSAIVPGVMAQTGMETLEIIKGVVRETAPELVIVIDALAARSTKRLNRTIQITDTGINPGSGVGNHRNAINKDTLGVPVIAIGVPTVVDAATIVNDTMEELVTQMDASEHMQRLGGTLGTMNRAEKQQMIRELISPHLNTMFVTPKDIDETVKYLSYTISEALNIVLSE